MSGAGIPLPALVPVNSWDRRHKHRWSGIVASANGVFYCASQDADGLLTIQPEVQQVSYTKLPYLFTHVPLDGIAIGHDGIIHFPPICIEPPYVDKHVGLISSAKAGAVSEDA